MGGKFYAVGHSFHSREVIAWFYVCVCVCVYENIFFLVSFLCFSLLPQLSQSINYYIKLYGTKNKIHLKCKTWGCLWLKKKIGNGATLSYTKIPCHRIRKNPNI